MKGFLQGPQPAPVTCPFHYSNMAFLPTEGSPVQDRKGMGTREELVIGKERNYGAFVVEGPAGQLCHNLASSVSFPLEIPEITG